MKKAILTKDAPQPIGPYSQAIQAGDLLFLSGQIPLDPHTGELVAPENVEGQTEQVLKNLEAVLKAAQTDFDSVVRCTIFLKDMGDFPKVNAIYAKAFEGMIPPARACVEVARLPKDVLVEIDAIARL